MHLEKFNIDQKQNGRYQAKRARPQKLIWSHHPINEAKSKGRVRHKLLLYMVVFASSEFKKIQECCNCDDNCFLHA